MDLYQTLTYFKGEVRFISSGIFNTKFSIVENGAIIKVKNSLHIKMIENQFSIFPDSFGLLAPINAVKTINGKVPRSYLYEASAQEYITTRNLFY